MAIVPNKAGGIIDKPLTTHNRTVASEPNGTVVPQFSGEIVYDDANDCYWKAMAIDNNHWVMLTAPGP